MGSKAGPRPPSLPLLLCSQTLATCIDHPRLQLYTNAWSHVVSSGWSVHPVRSTRRALIPPSQFKHQQLWRNPQPHTDSPSRLTPLQTYFLALIKPCYNNNLLLCLPPRPVTFLSVDPYSIYLLSRAPGQ